MSGDFKQPRPSEVFATRPSGVVVRGLDGQPLDEETRFARAHVADRATLEAACGQTINPRVFSIEPQGSRIHVVVDPVPERFGQIVVPDSVRDRDPMGQGWVVAVGPEACLDVPHPGGPRCLPEDLVGRHIFFGPYVGKPLRLSVLDREYEGRILVMTDRDVWCVDWDPDPLSAERQFEHDLEAHLARRDNEAKRAEEEAKDRLARERTEMARRSLEAKGEPGS